MVTKELKVWLSFWRANRPSSCSHFRKYDFCTFHVQIEIELPGIGLIKGPQSVRPVHYQVQNRILQLTWARRPPVEIFYPVMTVFVASTDADCLEQSRRSKKKNEVVQSMLGTATVVSMELDSSDGH